MSDVPKDVRLIARFVVHVWDWGRNDQRATWLMHGTIAALFSASHVAPALLHAFGGPSLTLKSGYALGAAAIAVVYGIRELIDAYVHRKKGDWKLLDADVDWQGKRVKGVTPAYDGWGDFLVPFFHGVGAVAMWAA